MSEAIVLWDNIPVSIQREIYGLEEELEEVKYQIRCHNYKKDVTRKGRIERRITKLEKPYLGCLSLNYVVYL